MDENVLVASVTTIIGALIATGGTVLNKRMDLKMKEMELKLASEESSPPRAPKSSALTALDQIDDHDPEWIPIPERVDALQDLELRDPTKADRSDTIAIAVIVILIAYICAWYYRGITLTPVNVIMLSSLIGELWFIIMFHFAHRIQRFNDWYEERLSLRVDWAREDMETMRLAIEELKKQQKSTPPVLKLEDEDAGDVK